MLADLAPPARPTRRTAPDAGQRLAAALFRLARGQGTLLNHRRSPWASITFSGTRHSLCWQFDGAEAVAAGEALIDSLPDHEFAIPGQLVADASVTCVEHALLPAARLTVTAELLLLDEG